MPSTASTFGTYAASELIAAKSAGRSFKKDDLANFLDVLLHDWMQRTNAVPMAVEPVKIDAEAIYQAYPRKVGKTAAIKAIKAAIKNGNRADWLHLRTKLYSEAVATWPARDREFVPHPATWFNRGSYLDDPREWQAKGARTASTDQPRDYSKL